MNVTFYFDPSCPFSWITSRFILQVSQQRDITVSWQPFCLALKNDELEPRPGESKHAADHRDGHRVLRVMLAAQQQYDTPLIDSYTESGKIHHIMGSPLNDTAIAEMLDTLALPQTLSAAADDEAYDVDLQRSLDGATKIVGNDIGVPTIVYKTPHGTQGYFGPVLEALPPLEESLAIWDGLALLATTSTFYELKRSRPDGGPDTASTARC